MTYLPAEMFPTTVNSANWIVVSNHHQGLSKHVHYIQGDSKGMEVNLNMILDVISNQKSKNPNTQKRTILE